MDVDISLAEKTLKHEWNYVLRHPKAAFLDPVTYGSRIQQIRVILRGKDVTYRYILLTAALSKATNRSIHYRALQKQSKLQGAYDARSVAHKVVVPFEKRHGERLGGSNEPYLNRPARYTEFDLSNRDRHRAAQAMLYDLLEFCQIQSQKDSVFPTKFLREVLREMKRLAPTKRIFRVPPVQISFGKTIHIINEYLKVSGGGERLVAVSAAVFSSLSYVTGKQFEVKAYPVNWSDKFAKTAGDIEFRFKGAILTAVESKDKPILESDVRHCQMKAKQNNLSEYILLSGAGIANGDEKKIADCIESVLQEGINIYLLDAPTGLYPFLIFIGEKGRKFFLDEVGKVLNEIKATRTNKASWQSVIDNYLKHTSK